MAIKTHDLWDLYHGRHHLDPLDLVGAIEAQVLGGDLDYRTQLLVRDSVDALSRYWGKKRVQEWLQKSPAGPQIEEICRQSFEDDVGFPSLRDRVMNVTRPEDIRQYLRDLSTQVRRPLKLFIGGSAALILPGYVSRQTEDIDVVDEVPAEIRANPKVLEDLKAVHHLELAHFQRHYLPMGWENRVHSQAPVGNLQVYLIDVYDVFLSKLFSIRVKDRQDLKELAPQLNKEVLAQRLVETTQSMLAAPGLRERAENNWFMLFGETLPT